ncbi:MAG: InlB B-repeat-containing protein, partial [Firmicutes bacterium]|nr:InlB B-repeat-containing protein [Bacillota bacterium]
MNYKRIFVFMLCLLAAVAIIPYSGAFASENEDAEIAAGMPAADENVLTEDQPVTVIEDVADGTVISVGDSAPAPVLETEPEPEPEPIPETRRMTLRDNDVTVTGLLPETTELQADWVADPLAKPAPMHSPAKSGRNLMIPDMQLSLDGKAADIANGADPAKTGEPSDSAEDSWKAVAFYDIKLIQSGQAIQPDGTVIVTIENVPLTDPEKTVSVKHFLDSEEAIRAALREGSAEALRNDAYATAFPEAAAAAEAVCGEGGVVYIETITAADGLEVDGTTVSFPAKSFSIYAIGEEQPKNRLNIIFHQANSTDTISILVKQDDLPNLNTVLNDPGHGTLTGGQIFRGWTEVENDTAETGIFIDAIRELVRTMLNSGTVEDEQTLELWPLVYKVFEITYKDERGSVIREDDCLFRDNEAAAYTIDQDYTPISQDAKFMGWQVESGAAYVSPAPDQGVGTDTQYYLNGAEVTLSGDVVLKVYTPSGYWITFEENAKNASYTPPQFVKHLDPTLEPDTDPTRLGYSFGGWYTNEACTDGNEFTFGGTLDGPLTLYAKWIANDEADYTILIWKQDISGTDYDFEESIRLTGDVGA